MESNITYAVKDMCYISTNGMNLCLNTVNTETNTENRNKNISIQK